MALVNAAMNFRNPRNPRNFLTETRLASQEGLCSVELCCSAKVRNLVSFITGSTLTGAVREQGAEEDNVT